MSDHTSCKIIAVRSETLWLRLTLEILYCKRLAFNLPLSLIATLHLHFPMRAKLPLSSSLYLFNSAISSLQFLKDVCVLHFCLPSVTRRYSCPFLLPEFHSWVVSLSFFPPSNTQRLRCANINLNDGSFAHKTLFKKRKFCK